MSDTNTTVPLELVDSTPDPQVVTLVTALLRHLLALIASFIAVAASIAAFLHH